MRRSRAAHHLPTAFCSFLDLRPVCQLCIDPFLERQISPKGTLFVNHDRAAFCVRFRRDARDDHVLYGFTPSTATSGSTERLVAETAQIRLARQESPDPLQGSSHATSTGWMPAQCLLPIHPWLEPARSGARSRSALSLESVLANFLVFTSFALGLKELSTQTVAALKLAFDHWQCTLVIFHVRIRALDPDDSPENSKCCSTRLVKQMDRVAMGRMVKFQRPVHQQ
jgi:hypothetical protein